MTNDDRFPIRRPSRRDLLVAGAASAGAMMTGHRPALAQGAAVPLLKVDTRTIEVNRKAAKVFHVAGPGGRSGIVGVAGDRFRGALLNASGEPLQMHWHGQIRAPFDQDRARPDGGALSVGQTDSHDFELTPGTHWMHSHTLSEQQLLAAPMIAREKDAGDVQDVVIMLHDFAFRSPQEILAELGGSDAHAGHAAPAPKQAAPPKNHDMHAGHGAPAGGMKHDMSGHGTGHMAGMVHANDVRYDAYLANDRTLADPEVVRVEKGGRVRLRIINGATATAFVVSLPGLTAECVAVDGTPCKPAGATRFPMAQGQRIDLVVTVPAAGGAFPVLAQVEAARFLTGIVLATAGARVAKLTAQAKSTEKLLDLSFEQRLAAVQPIAAKPADKSFMMMLGEEPGYRWTINGKIHGQHQPLDVRQGERVEIAFMNPTSMAHPMHLHGHHFQVVAIGGRRMAGAVRDTVLVPPHMPVVVAFDAGGRGSWFLHCHHLYHMATGMMTELRVS